MNPPKESGSAAPIPWSPPGHFYSPIPSAEDVAALENQLAVPPARTLPAVDLNLAEQRRFLELCRTEYQRGEFPAEKTAGRRYYYQNSQFAYFDALALRCFIRHAQPRRIVEVGSGYSSCVILDANQSDFDRRIRCTFIDPFPERLLDLIEPQDRQASRILPQRLQDVDLAVFRELSVNDILFLDSTHVSRLMSDVNYYMFEILPALADGVFVHIHDIGYPFEYNPDFLRKGMAWNEAYLLRAFLQYNAVFRIMFWVAHNSLFETEFIARHMPLCRQYPGGSFWMKKGAGA